MTIREAITQVDDRKVNTYTQKDKIGWISRLDHRVKTLIIDTHVGAQTVKFTGYDENTNLDTELLVPAPFDEIYLRWLEAQIDYHDQQEERYNNAIDTFNALWSEFNNDYNRKHMHLGQNLRF